MTMTVPVAQLRIARDIRQAEDALNEALLRQSSLFTTVITIKTAIVMIALNRNNVP